MMILRKSTQLSMFMTLAFGLTLMSACDSNDSKVSEMEPDIPCDEIDIASPDSVCEDAGLILVTQEECDASGVCQTIEFDMGCGDLVTVLCSPELLPVCLEDVIVEPTLICEGEGLVLATTEECTEDTTCRTITTPRPCGDLIETLCRAPECDEAGYPAPGSICQEAGLVLATEEECSSGVDCQTLEFEIACGEIATTLCKSEDECLESGRVEPELICEGEGLVLATAEECAQGATCQTITTEGPCDLTFDTLCKEAEEQCSAYPTCAPGSVESTQTCARGELECDLVTECGQTISCRPDAVCDAEVTCLEDEVQSQFACEANELENEGACRVDSLCGQTIFCRPREFCRAIPTCVEGEIQSIEPCLATESTDECHAVTICSETIVCRQQ